MRSYQVVAHGSPLEARDHPDPEPQGRQVLLRTRACGVCHSDLHLWEGFFDMGEGRKLDMSGRPLPFTLGHEIVGEVVALGPDAAAGAEAPGLGDLRVAYPWIGCGDCPLCTAEQEHLCPASRALGVGADGGYSDHVLVPDPRYLFDPAGIPAELAGTYACSGLTAYSAIAKARVAATGRELLVVGAGGVGMAAIAIARAVLPDTRILAADVDAAKLEAAGKAGADEAIDAGDTQASRALAKETGGGVAAAIDFVGSESSARFAMSCLGRGSDLVVVGLFGGALSLSLPLLPLKAIGLRGTYVGSRAELGELLALARAGRIPPIPIERRPLAGANEALEDLRAGRVVGRAVLVPEASE